jgi:hypothetical protein
MRPRTGRARLQLGPLLLFTLVGIGLASAALRAHDPGLSSLDVDVIGNVVTTSLSIAGTDVALIAPGGEMAARSKLRALAHDAIRLSLDGETLRAVDEDVTLEHGAARVRLSFAIPASSRRANRLTITSDVPKRVSRGHRELVVVAVQGRETIEKVFDAQSHSVAVDLGGGSPQAGRNAWSFLTLGIRHILSGYDHLVFLAGLLLAACAVRELLVALTAFTAGHSVSLAMVVIAGVHAPASIVEPLIAASIAWIGLENLAGARRRARWFVVFGFGLIHGFGLAGALMDLGFGSSAADVAVALISFNAGVEVGQLAVAALMLPLVWMMRSRPQWHATLLPACSVLIAMAGGYWLIERLSF